MPVLCPDLNLLFLCVAKTGSTSVAQLLIDHYGGQWLPVEHIWDKTGQIIVVDYKHATPRALLSHNLVSTEQLAAWRVVAVTRNPFDWLVSLYEYRRQTFEQNQQAIEAATQEIESAEDYRLAQNKLHFGIANWIIARAPEIRQAYEQSFTENMQSLYGPLQQASVCDAYFRECEVEVLRYENLEQDVAKLLRSCGQAANYSLPKINVNTKRHRDWTKYYDQTSKQIVERVFLSDLRRYGYSWQGELAR